MAINRDDVFRGPDEASPEALFLLPYRQVCRRKASGETRMAAVLITGANLGLGLEFSRQYGADGWRV